ncbi:hypothetical protein D3C85_1298370 [compost metagenome]
MTQQRGHGAATGAGSEGVQVGTAGYCKNCVDRFLQGFYVAGKPPFTLCLARIAPTDSEGLDTAVEEKTDQALLRRQIKQVELVDLWRYHQQWTRLHLLGTGLVLDQLQHVVAKHHRTFGDAQIVAHLESRLVHLARHAAVFDQVPDQLRETIQNALAAGFKEALERCRVGQGVGRRHRLGQQANDELTTMSILLAKVAGADPVVHLLTPGQVSLHVATV